MFSGVIAGSKPRMENGFSESQSYYELHMLIHIYPRM